MTQTTLMPLMVKLVELQEENARLREDAERYRWLRSDDAERIGACTGFGCIDVGASGVAYTYEESLYGDELDAAIDAAIAAARKEQK